MMALSVIAASSSVLGVSSCVNQEYDLNKGIDKTVNLNGQISAPIGNTGKIMIGDFLELNGENGLVESETGDYSLEFSGSPVTRTVTVPAIELTSGNFIDTDGFEIAPIGIKASVQEANPDISDLIPLEGLDPVIIDNILDNGSKASISIDEMVDEVGDVVSEIGTVNLDARIMLAIAFSSDNSRGAVTVRKGLSLTLPEFIAIKDIPDNFTADGGKLTLNEDVVMSNDVPLEIAFTISSMDFAALKAETDGTQGYVEDNGHHYIRIDQPVDIDGLSLEVTPSDFGETFGEIPQTISFDVDVTADRLDITGATLVLDPDITIENQKVEIGEMPEFLTGADINLDIYNPVITLNISNSSPVAAALTARLQGYDENGEPTMAEPISIGSEETPVIINAALTGGVASTSTVYISRRPIDLDEISTIDRTQQNIVIDNLSDILATIPHSIEISDINVAPWYEDGNRYTAISFDGSDIEYSFSVDYDIDVPLAFGEKLRVEYPYDITGLNSSLNSSESGADLDITVNDARINMNFVNTLPLGMSVTAVPLDTEGNTLTGNLEVKLSAADGSDALVRAGSLENPSVTPVVINLRADSEAMKRLDGFRLDIVGTSSAETAGIALNSNQYIQITDISVSVDCGVETQF